MTVRRPSSRGRLRALAVLAVLALAAALLIAPTPALADATVTDCTPAGVQAALDAGGVITFDCGATTTIAVTSQLEASQDAELVGPITLDGGDATRVLHVQPDVMVTLRQITITHGATVGDDGPAVLNEGALTVDASTFSANTSGDDGGAIDNDGGVLTVTNSTFSDNAAADDGGAIHDNLGVLTVANSTFSGNSAVNVGGAIDGDADEALTVTNSTFSGNTAGLAVGAIANDGALTIANSILVGNSLSECGGPVTSQGHNLSDDASCGFTAGDQQNVSAAAVNLGPLADNGGPTLTMLPGSGSLAIDAGADAICAAPPVNNFDQRGFVRPAGAHCDIGSVEVGASGPSVSGIAVLRQSCGSGSATGYCLEWLVGLNVTGAEVTATLTLPDGSTQTVTGTVGRYGATIITPVDAYGTYTLTVTGATLNGVDVALSGTATRSIAIGSRFRR